MLKRVEMEGIKLPRLYIAETAKDVKLARDNGIPYVKWTQGVTELIKCILRPLLEERFPYIKWTKVLGPKKKFRSRVMQVAGTQAVTHDDYEIMDAEDFKQAEDVNHWLLNNATEINTIDVDEEIVDIADDVRVIENDCKKLDWDSYTNPTPQDMGSVTDYCGDVMSSVNLEVLQKLGMMPKFLGDIADCIKVNLSNRMRWTEGYNKKLGVPVGRFTGQGELRNLIILDISASIPRGIAATMISLIDTLRSQVQADLIITAAHSGFYAMEDELPSPDVIRECYPPGNEAPEFLNIANAHIKGREYGHVISFGDNDTPFRNLSWGSDFDNDYDAFTGTKVHAVHHYHTSFSTPTGYGKWCEVVSPNCEIHYNTDWCDIIKE